MVHNLKLEEVKSVSIFGEIKVSYNEGFFNGRISAVVMRDAFRIDVFSPFGIEELRIVYHNGSCAFIFPRENRITIEENCYTIQILESEYIEIENLKNLFLHGTGNEKVEILSYRIFHGIRYPEKMVWRGKSAEVKLTLKDVEFNKTSQSLP